MEWDIPRNKMDSFKKATKFYIPPHVCVNVCVCFAEDQTLGTLCTYILPLSYNSIPSLDFQFAHRLGTVSDR